MINSSSNQVVNFCELSGLSEHGAHSSRGLGHLPLKEEITGSNPVCATNYPSTLFFEAKISSVNDSFSLFATQVATHSLQLIFSPRLKMLNNITRNNKSANVITGGNSLCRKSGMRYQRLNNPLF